MVVGQASLANLERRDGLENMWSETLKVADIHDLTIYDACYLELALRRRLSLATLDKSLRRAALKAGVELLPQISR